MTTTNPTPTRRSADAGVSLIEVLVALLVFAIIASGIVAGMTTITRMTVDNRARVTAANLASQDIDLVRAISDPFGIAGATSDIAVDGRTYRVKRSVSWVSKTGADVSCNSSTNLLYLRVNVRVTWPEMLSTTAPVQDDTIIAPAGRVSDTSAGSVGISVVGADNDPQAGVAVTMTPTSGGKALTAMPKPTGADGCTYASSVAPGTYDVTISKNGWLDAEQQSGTATESVVVTEGGTQSPSFPLYAQAATFKTNYVGGPVAYTGAFALPSNLETTWTNTSGTWATSPPATTVQRFPYSSGYGVIAGREQSGTKSCTAVDPQAWPAGSSNGVALTAGTRATTVAAAGQTASVSVPVGVVLVKAPAGQILGATQATPAAGTPSCGITGTVYQYPGTTTGNWTAVALPYGSWHFYAGTSVANAQPLAASLIQVKTNAVSAGVAPDGTVTLDPRSAD
jgi:prepilin-type N-terminal cleavage/methylation domain-containing protein